MDRNQFFEKLKQFEHPVIVDFWAPWCSPCRAMEPAFRQASQKYHGQVDVLKINADESPDVLKALGVMGIPTVIAFVKDREILRRTGMQSPAMLDILFEAAINQRKPDVIPPAPLDRILRTTAGLVMLLMSWFYGYSWWSIAAGAVLIFSAFYDRCPVFRMIAPKIMKRFEKGS